MAIISVYNTDGDEIDKLELDDKIFGVKINKYAMHMSVVNYLANQRQGTKSAKTRAEVRGGGRKPWRQKGTGHARQGSIRSPQWRGGGVVFAPKPRNFGFKINKKIKRLALKSALSVKLKSKKIIVLDKFELQEIKTKLAKKVLDNLKINNALIITSEHNKNIYLSARNLSGIKILEAKIINIYDILKFDILLTTRDGISKIQEVYA